MKPAPGDWPSYNHDPASTRYSPLTQINTKNVATLKPAWTFSLKGEGAGAPIRRRRVGSDADCGERHPVRHSVGSRGGAGWRNGQRSVELHVDGKRPSVDARRGVLAGRQAESAAHHLHRRAAI